ncbi:MAG: EamA family transporter, partial [Vicinamibacteria bacterium]
MSLELTLLLLFAAVMHAVWNAVVKASRDPLVELATLNLAGGIVCLPLLPAVGFPGLASAPYLLGNMLCHSAYYAFLLHSYSAGGLSLVYPIARGAAPLLVAGASVAILGESLGWKAVVGIVLIGASVVSLALSGGTRYFQFRAVLFSLATG